MKAYGTFYSQIALVYLQSYRHNSIFKCVAQTKIATIKPIIFGVQGLSKSSQLIQLTSNLSKAHVMHDSSSPATLANSVQQ